MARKTRKKSSRRAGARISRNSTGLSQLDRLSDELLCHVLSFLPLKDVLHLALLCRRLYRAVQLHLRLRKIINFTEGKIYGYMPASLTDEQVTNLLSRCSKVVKVLGLHPQSIEKRRQRNKKALSIPGLIEALSLCENLQGVETSDLKLMEAILQNLPEVDIIGHFWNRGGQFPIPPDSLLHFPPYPHLTSLHLTGVEIFELPQMIQLEYIYLQWVRFTRAHPFRNFLAPNLQTFVMKNCAGPANAMNYVVLIVTLAWAIKLSTLTLIRVPFLGGSIQRVVEDHMRNNGFQALKSITFGSCRHLVEADLGYLMLTCNQNLETMQIQPSITKDSVFIALQLAEPDFSKLQCLYLGFIDDFPPKGTWTNEELIAEGLADVVELPAPITDVGMKIVNNLFPNLVSLTVNWCPHVMQPTTWNNPGGTPWKCLRDLILKHCHCLKLEDFAVFLSSLPSIECLILEDVFREPPRGCSHVGLSAATGLGMTSAIVGNPENPVTVEGNLDNNENADAPRDLIDAEDEAVEDENQNRNFKSIDEMIDESRRQNQSEFSNAGNIRPDTNNNDIEIQTSRQDIAIPGPSGYNGPPQKNYPKNICSDCGTSFVSVENVNDSDISPSYKTTIKSRKCDYCKVLKNFKNKESKKTNDKLGLTDEDPLAIPGPSGLCHTNKDKRCSTDQRKDIRIGDNGKQLIDCGCQVNSDDIRQATKKLMTTSNNTDGSTTVYCGPGANLIQGNSSRQTKSSKAELNKNKRKNSKKRNLDNRRVPRRKNMCDKATSTSDPVFKEEPIQIFRIVSDTLASLTMISCGISTIQVDYCPKLEHLEVEACAVMKNIQLKSCPNLIRLNISQCPQVDINSVAKEMTTLPCRHDRMIFYRPYQSFNEAAFEKELLQDCSCKYHLCIVQDYSPLSEDCTRNIQIVVDWLKLFHNINYDLIQRGLVNNSEIKKEDSYPWGRDLYTFHVSYSRKEFLIRTDVPWLREVWNMPIETKEGNEIVWDQNIGLYQPYHHGHLNSMNFLKKLYPLVQEKRDNSMYLHSLGIYVHLCNEEDAVY